QCRACELRGITPIARATTNEQSIILRFMDTGVQGALIPFVNTADDAERAVQSIKYQPRGKRGLAGIRAADFGRTQSLGDYVKQANEETLVIAQIETTEGLANLDAIVQTPDVDIIFIGPNDLANSLGHPGNIPHPDVQAAMDKIAAATLNAGKILGLMIYNSEGARQWRDKGARFISVPFESVMTAAVTNFLDEAKQ
ncbi:MAG TPA: 2-dehydro-3-deoxyglucarate aldolase, partial [Verrucomicrobiales bacterium]|nr:2-dehydro-3-deoxyglucarate aldolase [Verrucomicrobiales bacterium]